MPPSSPVQGRPGVHSGVPPHEHVPHAQLEPQVCVPSTLHDREASGAQTPWPAQPASCHVPSGPHVCGSVPQLPHGTGSVEPGAHIPVHTLPTQVEFMHATGLPHCPPGPQVSTPLPEHCSTPGVHATHTPVRHAGVAPPQAVDVSHCPLGPQSSTLLPEHCVAPGSHTPPHAPFTHAWLLHATGAPHIPLDSATLHAVARALQRAGRARPGARTVDARGAVARNGAAPHPPLRAGLDPVARALRLPRCARPGAGAVDACGAVAGDGGAPRPARRARLHPVARALSRPGAARRARAADAHGALARARDGIAPLSTICTGLDGVACALRLTRVAYGLARLRRVAHRPATATAALHRAVQPDVTAVRHLGQSAQLEAACGESNRASDEEQKPARLHEQSLEDFCAPVEVVMGVAAVHLRRRRGLSTPWRGLTTPSRGPRRAGVSATSGRRRGRRSPHHAASPSRAAAGCSPRSCAPPSGARSPRRRTSGAAHTRAARTPATGGGG